MDIHEAPVDGFLDGINDLAGKIRNATARRTVEKLYRKLIKYGCSVSIGKGEYLPGSRVLLGELLLFNFVEHKGSPDDAKHIMQSFHDFCLHPLAEDGRLLSYGMPYISAVSQEKRRADDNNGNSSQPNPQNVYYNPNSGDHNSKRSKLEAVSSALPDEEATVEDGIPSDTAEASRVRQGGTDENNLHIDEGSSAMSTEDERDSVGYNAMEWAQHPDGVAISRSRKAILEGICNRLCDQSVTPFFGKMKGSVQKCSVLWNSRFANIYALVSSIEGAGRTLACDRCSEFTEVLSTSFFQSLLRIFNHTRRLEDIDAIHEYIFQDITRFYHNYEAMLATFYAHITKLFHYSKAGCTETLTEEMNKIGLEVTSWLTDRRIHSQIEGLTKVKMHRGVCQAFMHLLSRDEHGTVEPEQLQLFSNAFISFTMGFVAYILDDILGAHKVAYDPYAPRGVNFCCGVGNMLHIANCMIEQYVGAVASFSSGLDKGATDELYTVAAPFLCSDDIYNWILKLQFCVESCNENQRRQCRLAVIIMYLIAVNHQQPFLRSEDLKYVRKIQRLPWLSVLRFASKDPVANYMVSPITIALAQSIGEGAMLNLTFGNTLFTYVDDAICDLQFEYMDVYGKKATKLALLEAPERANLHGYIQIIWADILEHTLLNAVELPSFSFLIYYCIGHLLPIIWTERRDPYGVTKSEGDLNEDAVYSLHKSPLEVDWSLHILNQLYCMEPSLCEVAAVDTLICNFIMQRNTMTLADLREMLQLTDNAECSDMQHKISLNYIALQQNPVNLLLRLPQSVLMNSFILRLFINVIMQLLYTLHKNVCYGFHILNMEKKSNLDDGYINSLQEASILNLVMELGNGEIPREMEVNIANFITMLTSRTTFSSKVVASIGLPMNSLLSCVDWGVPEDKSFEKMVEWFSTSVEALVKSSTTCKKSDVEGVKVKPMEEIRTHLAPYASGDVAICHLYNLLQRVFDMPTISKLGAVSTEDPNAQRFAMVINIYWKCLEMANTNEAILEFLKNSISIVVKMHYLCPWMINGSTEKLQSWCHNEKKANPQLLQLTSTVIQDLREIYQVINELEKMEEG